jgi:glucosamine--fructose-6-phosphate aminotransferase (isomerizing)
MSNPIGPEALINQVHTLGDLYLKDFNYIYQSARAVFDKDRLRKITQVYATGSGDSYFAALSMEMAFQELAGVSYSPQPALKFMEYTTDFIASNGNENILLIPISASGTSSRVMDLIERARHLHDQITIAPMVGKVDSPIFHTYNLKISVELPDLGRSPGIRTYVGSLMGLLSLAILIGEAKERYSANEADKIRQNVSTLADMVVKTVSSNMNPAAKAAKLYRDAKFISIAGSGPSFGTAMYSAAKTIEAAGVFMAPQDLEEWGHIERFAYPLNFPVLLIAPPGKSHWRAHSLAQAVKLLGHPLMAVISYKDQEIAQYADVILPVEGDTKEYISPLIYFIGGVLLAYHMALELDRCILMTDNEHALSVREKLTNQTKL